MFRAGDTVRLGNGSEGTVEDRIERVGFSGYRVTITNSSDPEQVGRTVAASPAGMSRIASNAVHVSALIGDSRVVCEVADTPAEKTTGLQRHAGLSDGEGMLFPFSASKYVQFHMGAVSFPIDIVFCNNYRVAHVVENAQPGTRERWGAVCDLVIEVRGGWCAAHKLRAGDKVRLNVLKDAAASYDLLRTLTTAQQEAPSTEKKEPTPTALSASKVISDLEVSGKINVRTLAATIYGIYLSETPEAVDRDSISQIEADRIVQSWECKAKWLELVLQLAGQNLLPGYSEDPKVYQQQVEWRIADELKNVVGLAHQFYSENEGDFDPAKQAKHDQDAIRYFAGRRAALKSVAKYAKAAQQLVLMLAPFGPEYMQEGGPSEAKFYDLLDLYDAKESEKTIDKKWEDIAEGMNFLDRDAIVRALVDSGYPDAVRLLKRAQLQSEPDVRQDVKTPGAVRRTPPGEAWAGNAIPADTAGVGGASPAHWDQQIGYDASNQELEDSARMRPSASRRVAGGDVHPGDRVKAAEKVDGLKDDQKGVCLEVQGDAVWIKFDGEPIPRWLKNDMVTQEEEKEQILQEIEQDKQEEQQEGGEGDDGGLAGLLGAMG